MQSEANQTKAVLCYHNLTPVIWWEVFFLWISFLSSKSDSVRKGFWFRKMEIEKPHVPNTGVISRLQRALGVIQPNEASCSSESSLSWLQMGQLGHDEKLWVCRPKLCLCISLDFLCDKRTPAIQFYIRINTSDLQKQWVVVADRTLPNLVGKKKTPKCKTRKLIHNIQSGLGSLLNVGGHSNRY